MSIFVTGTDTGCGKTVVSCALLECMKGLGVAATGMKPVATGAVRAGDRLVNADVEALVRASGVQVPRGSMNPYVFEPPCSPHIAAALAGRDIDLERIVGAYADCAARAGTVIVEGVGGWCVPLGGGLWLEDLPRALGLPVLLVVGIRLGCISHAVLTARAIATSSRPFAGWVANYVERDVFEAGTVIDTIAGELPAPLLGVIEWTGEPDRPGLGRGLEAAARALLDTPPTSPG